MATIRLDTGEYESGLNDARDKTNGFSDTLQSVGSAVSGVGSTLTQNISRPLFEIGKNILQAGMDYEAGMDEVLAISGATGEEILMLGDKAMEMAAKTKFSTAESAEAYKYMAMAGWDPVDMLNSLDSVMYLAGASGESLASTSDIVTDAMTAFGLAADGSSTVLKNGYAVEVSNAQRFTDVLAAASNNANTNVSMMGETFKYVGTTAGALGYSIEDVAIASGLMANMGIKAGSAGVALRNIITNMANPTSDMKIAMEALGVSLENDEGDMYSLMEVMQQLRDGFGGGQMDAEDFASKLGEIETAFESGELSEEEYEEAISSLAVAMYGAEGAQKAQIAAMLAGKYGMAGLLSIVNATDEDFNKLTEAIYNSNGATEEMYNIMTDNAEGAVTMLDSAINVLFTSLSEFMLPAFTDIVRAATEAVNWFGSLDDGTKQLILTIGGIALVAGPVLTTIGNIITAIGTISGAISGVIGVIGNVGKAVSGLFAILAANPIALVIAAVAALVAGLIALWTTNEGFRDAVKGIWEAITGFFQSAVDLILSAWEGVKDFFAGLWTGIQDIFSGVAEFFGGIFSAAAELVQSAWNAIVEFFSGVWESIKAIFQSVAEFFQQVFQAAVDIIKSIWTGIVDFFASVWQGICDIFGAAAEFFGGVFQAAWDAITAIWQAAAEWFGSVWQAITEVFAAVAEFFGGVFQAAWDAVVAVWEIAGEWFSAICDTIYAVFEAVTSAIGEFFEAAAEFVQEVWTGVKEFFTGVAEALQELWENVTTFFQEKFEEAAQAVKDAWETVKEFFQDVWNKITEIFGETVEWFRGKFQEAWEAVKSAWSGVKEFFAGKWSDIKGAFSDALSHFREIGSNIVNGLKDGIAGAWDSFWSWISGKVGGIVDGIKSMLGIHSPSTVFAGIGKNMALGLADGWDDQYGNIKRQIESGLDFSAEPVPINVTGSRSGYGSAADNLSGAGKTGGGDTYNFYSPKAIDAVTAARELKRAKQQMALGYI